MMLKLLSCNLLLALIFSAPSFAIDFENITHGDFGNIPSAFRGLNDFWEFDAVPLSEFKQIRCDQYAKSAVIQQTLNTMAFECDLTGPAWSSSWEQHFFWCMTASNWDQENLRHEREQRFEQMFEKMEVSGCKPVQERDSTWLCGLYAQRAIVQQERNLYYGCGFREKGWNSNYQDHFKWCENHVDLEALKDLKSYAYDHYLRDTLPSGLVEYSRRQFQLHQCTQCKKYEAWAVMQNQLNEDYSCGFTGPRWHSTTITHFQWCQRKVGKRETQVEIGFENDVRWLELLSCFDESQ